MEVHSCTLLRDLHSCRQVRVSTLTPVRGNWCLSGCVSITTQVQTKFKFDLTL